MKTKAIARFACIAAAVLLLVGGSSVLVLRLRAQQLTGRIAAEIDNGTRSVITGTRPPLARKSKDLGRVAPETPLRAISIVFNRSSAQEAALQALIAAQQNPASSLYHQWLTPDEFAVRFGMADSDITKVEAWLQEQGFSIDGVSRSHDRITFSGTAGQVQAAFGTELHYYNLNGETHFAPSSDLSVPAALASVVLDVTNLSTFRPKPRFRKPKPNFTSGQSGNTFLTPMDVATIYDVKPAYTAGFTGKGQSIAVVGQTSVSLTDIANFQNAAGLTLNAPTLVLVPNSGSVTEFQGDESESDLDLEYSGAMAPGASILFIYTGDSPTKGVFDSIQYAIDNDIAPIISDSYGLCETALGSAQYLSLNAVLAQGAAQGQSIIGPAGDSGSPDCAPQQQGLAVDFPASSQYVTGMGGSEFPAADVCVAGVCGASASTYWQSANGADVISSALSYIPEQVWNDDAAPGSGNPANLSAGGGGVSAFTSRPSWQNSLPGPGVSGTMRLVPDIALSASPGNAGYLYCSSDPGTGITGSCSNGFRDVNIATLTVAGGTSFDAPIFAGLVAIINQKENSVGQGVVNPTLYQLASNSSTYASAFHDITSGNNNCSVAGSTVCSGSSLTQYSAGTGYDLASGLGSIDFNHLLSAWPAMTGSSLTASRITLSPATTPYVAGTNDVVTITVASGSGSGTPTGTLKVVVDGTTATSSLALSGGTASYTFVSAIGGSHAVTVIYSGDSTFAASTGTLALGNQSFRLTATSPTIVAGSSGTSTVTITPQQGYTGSISWTISSSPAFTNGCYSLPNATVSSSTTATLTINTNSKVCGGAALLHTINGPGSPVVASAVLAHPTSPLHRAPFGLAMVGLLFAGVLAYRPGKLRGIAGLLLAVLTLALPGCGGGSSSTTNNNGSNVAPGTYTLIVVGTDTASSTISGSAAVAVTVN